LLKYQNWNKKKPYFSATDKKMVSDQYPKRLKDSNKKDCFGFYKENEEESLADVGSVDKFSNAWNSMKERFWSFFE